MTRRTLLVPLFAAAFILLAPAELSGKPDPTPDSAVGSDRMAGWKPALPAPGSPASPGRTGFYRWSASPYLEACGPQGRSASPSVIRS